MIQWLNGFNMILLINRDARFISASNNQLERGYKGKKIKMVRDKRYVTL